jgi:hypothetical protein
MRNLFFIGLDQLIACNVMLHCGVARLRKLRLTINIMMRLIQCIKKLGQKEFKNRAPLTQSSPLALPQHPSVGGSSAWSAKGSGALSVSCSPPSPCRQARW